LGLGRTRRQCCDQLNLEPPIRIVERCDPHECACGPTLSVEAAADSNYFGCQIHSRDIHGDLHDMLEACAVCAKGRLQICKHLLGLCRHVAYANSMAV